jgi:hypothetical protein
MVCDVKPKRRHKEERGVLDVLGEFALVGC